MDRSEERCGVVPSCGVGEPLVFAFCLRATAVVDGYDDTAVLAVAGYLLGEVDGGASEEGTHFQAADGAVDLREVFAAYLTVEVAVVKPVGYFGEIEGHVSLPFLVYLRKVTEDPGSTQSAVRRCFP